MVQVPPSVADFLAAKAGHEEESLRSIIEQLSSGQMTILNLVKALGGALISKVDAERCRGTVLLAEAAARAPAALRAPNEVHHLALFFSGRLADFPCLTAALRGCLALAERAHAPSAPACSAEDAVAIAAALLVVNVRSLVVGDRQLCLRLLLLLTERFGAALAGSELRVLEGAAAALDGERDPRCLLAAFACIRGLARLYWEASPASRQGLEREAEELVGVLACYFPIVYTPPTPAPPGTIAREELVAGVQAALAAVPALARHGLPLLLEKLGSLLRQAKVDALSALGACAEGYGADALQPFLPQIWTALRTVLLAPAALDLAPEDRAQAQELAELARDALRRCLRAADGAGSAQPLAEAVLEDAFVRDMLDDMAAPEQQGGLSGAAARVAAASDALAAVAGASAPASALVCHRLLGSLIKAAMQEQQPSAGRALALTAMLAIVRATRKCSIQQATGSGQLAAEPAGETQPLAGKGPAVLDFALRLDAERLADVHVDSPADKGRKRAEDVQLALVAQLATFPCAFSPLSEPDQENALRSLLRSTEQAPEHSQAASGDGDASIAAGDALAEMARQGHTQLLSQVALPVLLQAAIEGGSSSSAGAAPGDAAAGSWQGASALAALSSIAAASEDLCLDIRSALTAALCSCLQQPAGRPGLLSALMVTLACEHLLAPAKGATKGEDVACLVLQAALSDLALPQEALKPATALVSLATRLSSSSAQLQAPTARLATGYLMSDPMLCDIGEGQEWRAAQRVTLCSAAVAGLATGVTAAGSSQQAGLLQLPPRLLALALRLQDDAAAEAAASAAASFLNKGDAGLVDEAAERAVQILLPHLRPWGAAARRACMCAGHLSRALAMRGHNGWQEVITAGLILLEQLAAQQAAENGSAMLGATAADVARMFEALLSGDRAGQLLSWEDGPHVAAKVLWQQRTFSIASELLLQRLQNAQQGKRSAEATGLRLCLGRLIRGAAPAVVRAQLAQLLPWVLAALGDAALDDEAAATAHLLTVIEALMEPAGAAAASQSCQALLEDQLDALVPALLHQIRHARGAATRATAAECLLAAMGLPYALLHPHRAPVLAALAHAVDDRKRAVRMAAVRCRRAWNAV